VTLSPFSNHINEMSKLHYSSGSCEGRKPYGSREGEAKVISRILALRKAGAAMDTIAETLNVERLAPRSGGQWYGSTVRNILLREASTAE
jgi:Recombinase